jgi:hypothetical protein
MKKTEPTATPAAAPTNDKPISLEDFWGPEMLADFRSANAVRSFAKA